MDISEMLHAVKNDSTKVLSEPVEETTDNLLDQLTLEIPKDPRVEKLKSVKDSLLEEDYWHIHKMITTFDLSDEELNEELERYGIQIQD